MTYDEAIAADDISYQDALAEVKRHGITEAEFITEFGKRAEYCGQEILDWLGY